MLKFKRIIPPLTVCLLAFFSAYIIRQAYGYIHTPYHIRKEVQQQFLLRQQQADVLLDSLTNMKHSRIHEVLMTDYTGQKFFEEKGLLVLLYENDRLTFASSNAIPVPEAWTSDLLKPVALIGNAYFSVVADSVAQTKIMVLQLVQYQYLYENDRIRNVFAKAYPNTENVQVSLTPGTDDIFDVRGNFCFSLHYEDTLPIPLYLQWIWLILFAIAWISFLITYWRAFLMIYNNHKRNWLLLVGLADIILIRWFMTYFHLPGLLYEQSFFQDQYPALGTFSLSLGDMCFHLLAALVSCWFLFATQYNKAFQERKSNQHAKSKIFLLLALFVVSFYIYGKVFKVIVLNPETFFDFQHILQIDSISFLMIICLALLSCATCLFHLTLYQWLSRLVDFLRQTPFEFSLFRVFILILFYTILSGFLYNHFMFRKERHERLELAQKLAKEKDPLAEKLFLQIRNKVLNDSVVIQAMNHPVVYDDSLQLYLKNTYFTGYWDAYHIQVTTCKEGQQLLIGSDAKGVDCDDYFDNTINTYALPTLCPYFYLLNYTIEYSTYLGVLHYKDNQGKKVNLYVEITAKFVLGDLGYPDLLIENPDNMMKINSQYSYALYYCGVLMKQNGRYVYPLQENRFLEENGKSAYFLDIDKHNHLIYPLGNGNVLVLTKSITTPLEKLSSFSFLFLFYGIFTIFIFLVFVLPVIPFVLKFRNRLQIITLSLVLGSFILVGYSSFVSINALGRSKNRNFLREKSHSVLMLLEKKYGNMPALSLTDQAVYSEELLELANTFFTDIHLFLPNGALLASSRMQIFSDKIIAPQINMQAYKELEVNHKNFFMQYEHIGTAGYLSAYVPLLNNHNQLLAYINLPYFAKQNESRDEFSGFLTYYINLYVLFLVIAFMLTILLSRYLTNPLKIMSDTLGKMKFGQANSRIALQRKDEIGDLVNEYNRMVDALEKSATRLADSERKSAWHEMAKQVAHEIKNPLTPMKLNVQQLQRAWNDKADDFDVRMKRFADSMVEQIDALSDIASAFSDFANLSLQEKKDVDLVKILETVIATFDNKEQITFTWKPYLDEALVFGNEKQLLRVFNNLVKNAVQAMESESHGMLDIEIQRETDHYIIEISDNGCGIPKEMGNKIFEPNFTSKTGGTGLGLAIAKNILEIHGGSITYTSVVNVGTTFFVKLPQK